MHRLIVACVFVVLAAWPVSAQVADVNNPTGAEWDCSADHATIDGYELDLLRPDGSVLQTLSFLDAAKPVPVAGKCRVGLNVQPVAFGVGYSARVRAKGATAYSDYSVSVNKFNRIPGKPGAPMLIAMAAAPAPLG